MSKSITSSVIKFIVGPKKSVFLIEKEKLKEFLHSPHQLDDNCNLDISIGAFLVFLDMTQKNKVEITSATIALDLLVLAKKLICFQLVNLCLEYLKSNYECDRAIAIHEYAKTNRVMMLEKNCLRYIAGNIRSLISNEDFFKLRVEAVAELFSCKFLRITELELLMGLVSYAQRQSVEDIRSHMKIAVDKIRFEDIEAKALLKLKGIDCLLTEREQLEKLSIIIDRCTCQRSTAMRAEHQTISINYDNVYSSSYDEAKPMVAYFKFSQDLTLKSVDINDSIIDITTIILTVANVQTAVTRNGSRVDIDKKIKKGDQICLTVKLPPSKMVQAGMLTPDEDETMDVIMKPKDQAYHHVLLKRISVRRMELDATLVVEWGQERRSKSWTHGKMY